VVVLGPRSRWGSVCAPLDMLRRRVAVPRHSCAVLPGGVGDHAAHPRTRATTRLHAAIAGIEARKAELFKRLLMQRSASVRAGPCPCHATGLVQVLEERELAALHVGW